MCLLFCTYSSGTVHPWQLGTKASEQSSRQEGWHLQDGWEAFDTLCVLKARSQQPFHLSRCWQVRLGVWVTHRVFLVTPEFS